MISKALILYGSPKGMKGSSANLANFFFDRLTSSGSEVSKIVLYKSIDNQESLDKLLSAFNDADLILLSFPIYTDTLPAGVSAALYEVCERKDSFQSKKRIFAAIANCGFPEAAQNDVALEACRHFARRMDMQFAGGIAIGEGGMLGESPIMELKYASKHIPLLEKAAEAMARGENIPKDVIQGLRRPFVPPFLYSFFNHLGWNKMAKMNGVRIKTPK